MHYSFNQHLIVFNGIYYFYYTNFFSHVLAVVAFWFPALRMFSFLYLIVCLIIFNFFTSPVDVIRYFIFSYMRRGREREVYVHTEI